MPAAPREQPNRLPEGYDFVRLLGRGANGVVVLARQEALGRLVAVKVVLGGAADAGEARRLQREGQALARLTHPSVVRVYELARLDDDLALVLEFVDGTDLRRLLTQVPLSVPRRLAVLTDVAGALDHAAKNGVVHRDVKPSNVLIPKAGPAKVADFGVARLLASAAAFRSDDGRARGTPLYMAPEALLSPELATPAMDSYSFAVMAYELLTGVTPFNGTVDQVVAAQLNVEPPPPREVQPAVPAAASDAVMAGLSKDPDRRPAAVALADRLDAIPEGDWGSLEQALQVASGRAVQHGPALATENEHGAEGGEHATRVVTRSPSVQVPVNAPWVQPVDVPVRARRRRYPFSAWAVGLAVGGMVGFVVAALVVVLR